MDEERARFCNNCNAVVGWYASFCDGCGMRVSVDESEGASSFTSQAVEETASSEQDLYRAHLRLIHKSRERSEGLKKGCARVVRKVQKLELNPRADESVRKAIGLSERLIDLADEWEALQHQYNMESEGIEEDFLSRIDDLEADLELAPHHQAAIEEEAGLFMRSLEDGAEELRETGRLLEVVRALQNSRFLAFGGTRRATLGVGFVAFLLAFGGVAYGLVVEDLAPEALAFLVGPAILGLFVLFLHARSRP
ncbi:MAG: hypothetical protein HRU14_13720 [Planctomycetes bacterium]|nr:hypothetical protein [Planctomycetota bacterium]